MSASRLKGPSRPALRQAAAHGPRRTLAFRLTYFVRFPSSSRRYATAGRAARAAARHAAVDDGRRTASRHATARRLPAGHAASAARRTTAAEDGGPAAPGLPASSRRRPAIWVSGQPATADIRPTAGGQGVVTQSARHSLRIFCTVQYRITRLTSECCRAQPWAAARPSAHSALARRARSRGAPQDQEQPQAHAGLLDHYHCSSSAAAWRLRADRHTGRTLVGRRNDRAMAEGHARTEGVGLSLPGAPPADGGAQLGLELE